jgi:hypothetical protein
MSFEIYSNENARILGVPYITVDRHGRIYLSKNAQKEIGVYSNEKEFHYAELFVYYDSHNKRIALARKGIVNPTDIKPFRFSGKEGRKYGSCLNFLNFYGILPKKSNRYFYEGKDSNGLHAFKLENSESPTDDNAYKPKKDKRTV